MDRIAAFQISSTTVNGTFSPPLHILSISSPYNPPKNLIKPIQNLVTLSSSLTALKKKSALKYGLNLTRIDH